MTEIAKLDNTKRFVDLSDDEYEKLAALYTFEHFLNEMIL